MSIRFPFAGPPVFPDVLSSFHQFREVSKSHKGNCPGATVQWMSISAWFYFFLFVSCFTH